METELTTEEEQEINPLEILHVLVKRKALILKVCAVSVVVSAIYALTLPNIYSATAKILPPQKEGGGGLSSLIGQAGGGLVGLAAGGLGGGGELYVSILKSRSVADAIMQRPDLSDRFKGLSAESARANLAESVAVQGGKDGLITITASDEDPKRSALLANAFVDELGKATVRLNLSKIGTERAFLEKRLDVVKKDLKQAEDDMKGFAQTNKMVQVEAQTRASIDGIARLKADLAAKEVQLAVLSSRQTEQSPEVKALQNGIRRLRSEIGAMAGGIPSIGNVPGVGLEYSRRLRELKTQEVIFEQLSKQYEMAKINEAKDSSSFQVLDQAVAPSNKSKPARAKIVLVSLVLAFSGSVLMIFLQECLANLSEDNRRILESIKKQALSFK